MFKSLKRYAMKLQITEIVYLKITFTNANSTNLVQKFLMEYAWQFQYRRETGQNVKATARSRGINWERKRKRGVIKNAIRKFPT